MAARIAWVLNLDADLELATSALGGYTPKQSVRDATREYAERFASTLDPADLIVDESSAAGVVRGLSGRAFCPTPRAIGILTRAGAEPEPHPPIDVLRRVNSRAFSSALGTTLPHASFVTELEIARQVMSGPPELGVSWRVKRAFGMAGRGQRLVTPNAVTEADLAFVRAGLSEGGVQIEPSVTIVDEYSIHGVIAESGTFALGALVAQRCDPHGAWVSAELASKTEHEHEHEHEGRLVEEAERVAVALWGAGYFGPFGIDAYTYRDRDGAIRLQPRSEINARYTMGFAVGFPSAIRARG